MNKVIPLAILTIAAVIATLFSYSEPMGVNNLDGYVLFVGDLVQMTKLGIKGDGVKLSLDVALSLRDGIHT